MVGVLIRMKVALIRNSMTQGKAAWMGAGLAIGLIFAVGTISLGLLDTGNPTVPADLLGATFLVWLLGWLMGPMWSGAPVLRAEQFSLLGLPPRRLAAGLLAATFVGVGATVTLLAFAGLVVYAVGLGLASTLVAVPGVVLQLTLVVVLSRVAAIVLGIVAASRLGAAVTGVLLAALLVLAQSGWMVYVAISYSGVLTEGFGPAFAATVRAVPSGWALVAVEAAGTRDWWLVAAALSGLVALILLLLFAFSLTLRTPRRARVTIRGSSGRRPTGNGATAALVRKELRTWRRDPGRVPGVVMPVVWALGTTLLPLTFDANVVVPFAAPALAVMAATAAVNLYGQDGTALWLTLTTGTERPDVRARQWALAIIFVPLTAVVAVASTVWSGLTWAWPWVLALTPALLGGGIGLAALVAVMMLAPGPDAHRRTENPLEAANTTGQSNLVFFSGAATAAPPAALLWWGSVADNDLVRWLAVPVGVATGVLLAWWLGNIAANRLQAQGPELLHLMRSGRPAVAKPAVTVPRRATGAALLGWTLGSIALFPQGIVAMVLLVVDPSVKVWFLAMHLPAPWQWPTAMVMVLIGLTLYVVALKAPKAAAPNKTMSTTSQT